MICYFGHVGGEILDASITVKVTQMHARWYLWSHLPNPQQTSNI